jgi:hypothetical protein
LRIGSQIKTFWDLHFAPRGKVKMVEMGKIDKDFVFIKCAKIIVKWRGRGQRRGFMSIWLKNVESCRKIWKNV